MTLSTLKKIDTVDLFGFIMAVTFLFTFTLMPLLFPIARNYLSSSFPELTPYLMDGSGWWSFIRLFSLFPSVFIMVICAYIIKRTDKNI